MLFLHPVFSREFPLSKKLAELPLAPSSGQTVNYGRSAAISSFHFSDFLTT